MNITCLGSGGYQPTETRHTSCFLLASEGIVLDAGTGLFRLPQYLETDKLDILLSHAHLDHVVGLTYLLHVRDRCPNIVIHGEASKLAAVQQHLFSELLFPILPSVTFRPLEESSKSIVVGDQCQVSWFPLTHPGGSIGYRLDWPDRALGYVTDTTADPASPYIPHVHGVSLLVHECYFDDDQSELAQLTGHSCVSDVAQVALAAKAKQLALMHIDPQETQPDRLLNKCREQFADTVLCRDRETMSF